MLLKRAIARIDVATTSEIRQLSPWYLGELCRFCSSLEDLQKTGTAPQNCASRTVGKLIDVAQSDATAAGVVLDQIRALNHTGMSKDQRCALNQLASSAALNSNVDPVTVCSSVLSMPFGAQRELALQRAIKCIAQLAPLADGNIVAMEKTRLCLYRVLVAHNTMNVELSPLDRNTLLTKCVVVVHYYLQQLLADGTQSYDTKMLDAVSIAILVNCVDIRQLAEMLELVDKFLHRCAQVKERSVYLGLVSVVISRCSMLLRRRGGARFPLQWQRRVIDFVCPLLCLLDEVRHATSAEATNITGILISMAAAWVLPLERGVSLSPQQQRWLTVALSVALHAAQSSDQALARSYSVLQLLPHIEGRSASLSEDNDPGPTHDIHPLLIGAVRCHRDALVAILLSHIHTSDSWCKGLLQFASSCSHHGRDDPPGCSDDNSRTLEAVVCELLHGIASVFSGRTSRDAVSLHGNVSPVPLNFVLRTLFRLSRDFHRIADMIRQQLLNDASIVECMLNDVPRDMVGVAVSLLALCHTLDPRSEQRRRLTTLIAHAPARYAELHGSHATRSVSAFIEQPSRDTVSVSIEVVAHALRTYVKTPQFDTTGLSMFVSALQLCRATFDGIGATVGWTRMVWCFRDAHIELSQRFGASKHARQCSEQVCLLIELAMQRFPEEWRTRLHKPPREGLEQRTPLASSAVHPRRSSTPMELMDALCCLGMHLAIHAPPRFNSAQVQDRIVVAIRTLAADIVVPPLDIALLIAAPLLQNSVAAAKFTNKRPRSRDSAVSSDAGRDVRRLLPYIQLLGDVLAGVQAAMTGEPSPHESEVLKATFFGLCESTMICVLEHQRSIKMMSSTNILTSKPLVRLLTPPMIDAYVQTVVAGLQSMETPDSLDVVSSVKQSSTTELSPGCTTEEGSASSTPVLPSTGPFPADDGPLRGADKAWKRYARLCEHYSMVDAALRALELSPHAGFTVEQRERLLVALAENIHKCRSGQQLRLIDMIGKGEILFV